MCTYLVTGVAGFIASRTAELLLQKGHNVVGIDNLNGAYDVRMKRSRLDTLRPYGQFSFHMIDIQDAAALNELFDADQFDAVIHLAGRAGVRYSMENPHVYMAVNAMGTLNVLEAMRLRNVKKIVFASTSSLYAGQPLPFNETLPVNQPISVYAASKKAAEVMTYTYHHLFGFDVSVLRYFTVYGPAGRPDMSPFRFVKWINEGKPIELFGDGNQTRDFTYIDDIAEGTIAAIKSVGCETFNLGGGRRPYSINEMIGIIETQLGKQANIVRKAAHPADMAETQANIEKARAVLDWTPKVDLQEGLQRTVNWYHENHTWARNIRT